MAAKAVAGRLRSISEVLASSHSARRHSHSKTSAATNLRKLISNMSFCIGGGMMALIIKFCTGFNSLPEARIRIRAFIPKDPPFLSFSPIAMVYSALFIPALAAFWQIHAVPTIAFPRHNISSSVESSSVPSTCDDIHNCRTLWSIIYSCVVTVFACVYLALHPNVPDPTHRQWRMRAVRVCSTFIAFLAPELVVMGAASQWWVV